jgi:hypothetical protein
LLNHFRVALLGKARRGQSREKREVEIVRIDMQNPVTPVALSKGS